MLFHDLFLVVLCSELNELKNGLGFYNKKLSQGKLDEDSLYKLIQKEIQSAIEEAIKSEGIDIVREQIKYLCQSSFDIPAKLRDWTIQEVDVLYKTIEKEKKTESVLPPPPTPEEKPLLSKDTLYHASLCCQAVSTCTAANYQAFFSKAVNGHNLKEVSMSISRDREDVDRYIIAKQENDIVYMAFQSEATLDGWINSSYGSFAEGID